MLTPEKQVEIAKRGMDAAFGYSQAAINAAFEMTARTLSIWDVMTEAVLQRPAAAVETWEWSGAAKRPHSTLLAEEQQASRQHSQSPAAIWLDVMHAGGRIWFRAPPSPFAWWAWTPQSAVPATWPWAYGMISSGVPASVAWPMAEANVALMDAAKKTAEAAQPSFPVYQSSNGFAGHVWTTSSPMRTVLAMMPATAMILPWMQRAA